MSYWDNIDENSPSLLVESTTMIGESSNYYNDIQYKLLDEWLEEDKILLSEAEVSDSSWVDNWFTGSLGNIWNGLKGLVVGKLNDKGGYSTKGLAGYIKSWFGGRDPNKVGIVNGIKLQADKLSDFMRKNSNITTAGLAAAGLLGTYYLYKKWKNNKNKKPDAATIKTAVELDQRDPNQIPPNERNQKIEA